MLNFLKGIKTHPRDKEMIEIFDSTGCKSQIQFKEWRTKVVPHNIKNNWNNPDGLAHWVLGGLRDKLAGSVDEASKRLMKISNDQTLAICLRANVLMDLKRFKEMEQDILQHLKEYPKTGAVLTNLAKAQISLNKDQESMSTLEEGLKIDPNQDNGLLWWCSLYRELERKGLEISDHNAHLMSLVEANRRFGGWRVKEYLGSFFADQKQKDVAIDWFKRALQEKGWQDDLLQSITGHLGKNGFIKESLEIVEPIYNPSKNNFAVGINLLQSYLELQMVDKGQDLLDKLFSIRDVGIEERLLWYQSKFNDIKGKEKVVPNNFTGDDEIGLSSIDNPLWATATGGKKTGFEIKKNGKKIALMQFFKSENEIKEATLGNECDIGKVARTIPLYLLENIYYGSDASPSFIFPTTKKGNYVLLQNLDIDWVKKMASSSGFDGVFSGQISEEGIVELTYIDMENDQIKSTVIEDVDLEKPDQWIPQIENFFFSASQIDFDPSFNVTNKGFKKITGESLASYLDGISQRLAVALSSSNKRKDFIYGERNIIRWLFNEAGYYKDAIQCQLGMLSAVRQFINYDSSAAKEYQKEIRSWLQDCSQKYPNLKNLSEEVLKEFNDWIG